LIHNESFYIEAQSEMNKLIVLMSKQWIVRFWDIYTSFVGVVIKFMNELK